VGGGCEGEGVRAGSRRPACGRRGAGSAASAGAGVERRTV
jgi:hypothetical protein